MFLYNLLLPPHSTSPTLHTTPPGHTARPINRRHNTFVDTISLVELIFLSFPFYLPSLDSHTHCYYSLRLPGRCDREQDTRNILRLSNDQSNPMLVLTGAYNLSLHTHLPRGHCRPNKQTTQTFVDASVFGVTRRKTS